MRATRAVVAIAVATAIALATAGAASGVAGANRHGRGIGSELAEVRRATAGYHRLSTALADGYVPFSLDPTRPDEPTCFDSADGGMGVHYVRNIDAILDPSDPEALVYELGDDGRERLVAVEYIIPSDLIDPDDPPELLGEELHPHSFLPVHILHAWVWKHNPTGTFADFNPRVGDCPA